MVPNTVVKLVCTKEVRYYSIHVVCYMYSVSLTFLTTHYDVQTFIFLSEVNVRCDSVGDSTDGWITSHSTHSKHGTVRAGKADSCTLLRRQVSDDVRDCLEGTGEAFSDVTDIAVLTVAMCWKVTPYDNSVKTWVYRTKPLFTFVAT